MVITRYAVPFAAERLAPPAALGTAFGPPPPSLALLEATGIAGWLIVAWGYWIDRHRSVRLRHQGA